MYLQLYNEKWHQYILSFLLQSEGKIRSYILHKFIRSSSISLSNIHEQIASVRT